MTYCVIIQPQAEAEIEAAYLWRRERDARAASRWLPASNASDDIPMKIRVSLEAHSHGRAVSQSRRARSRR